MSRLQRAAGFSGTSAVIAVQTRQELELMHRFTQAPIRSVGLSRVRPGSKPTNRQPVAS
jgi:hypothetical protein